MAPGRAPDKASGTSLVHRIFRKTSGARGKPMADPQGPAIVITDEKQRSHAAGEA